MGRTISALRHLRLYGAATALLVAPLQAGLAGAGGAEEVIPVEPVVIFNTLCARCHEGECSGRMTFDLSEDAADAHIRRHGGDLPLGTVRQLGDLLGHMKGHCGFYPLPLALARDGTWTRDTLDLLRTPDGTAYFLPLGELAPGPHRLWLQGLPQSLRPCAELLTADFDPVPHAGIDPDGERRGLSFLVDAPGGHYLRLSARVPVTLTRVELVSDEAEPR